ncbi:hypothetical protein F5Y16DRAFT_32250 [Xylariaceae sp. FL0255]|nr:hypothetical protein F5Y16DRAFT_32250 [Xylariaceae sp. FL0255]
MRIRWTNLCDYLTPRLERWATDLITTTLIKMNQARMSTTPTDLLSFLDTRHSCQASDPRDMIFALLGVASGCREALACIDINYALSAEQVYIQTTRYLLGHFNLGRLAKSIALSAPRGVLPSWVPDWGVQSPWTRQDPEISPGKSQPRANSFDPVLVVGRTKKHEVIQEVSEILPPSTNYSKRFRGRIDDIVAMRGSAGSYYGLDLGSVHG